MNANIAQILLRLDSIDSLIPHLHLQSDAVSAWSVGQQIDHVISATSTFSVLLLRDRRSDGKAEKNAFKDPVLSKGAFPRGVIKAPKGLDNPSQPEPIPLSRAILKCRTRVSKLEGLSAEAVATHQLMGEMSRDEIIRFLIIHLDHHLAIIQDILADHNIYIGTDD